MNFSAVFHRATAPFSYALDTDTLVIKLQTDKNIDKVFIHWGDPFEAGILGGAEIWKGQKQEITDIIKLEHHLWWEIKIKPPYKRCKYYFELHQDNETWFYGEDGFTDKLKDNTPACFFQPWINPADIISPPEWVKKTVWYQIFPDRFNKSKKTTTQGLCEWKTGSVTNEQKFGGNLQGITEKLNYLSDLGITGLYLTPIFKAETVHKYDTTDYKQIDPDFGTEEDLKNLVDTAHKLGIKIMLDAVFNHSGDKFAPWLDVKEKGKNSPYWDWFMINDWSAIEKQRDTRDGRYYSFAFISNMPKLNTNNPEVIKYISELCADWVENYNIDGIRFDVGNEISHRLIKEIRQKVHKIKKDVYLLGEIWHDSSPWLEGDEYDAVMNYPFKQAVSGFFEDKTQTSSQLEWKVKACMGMYRKQTQDVMFNLLDSHDTDRLITRLNNNQDAFFQQLTMLFTLIGSPCIYYGTETALEGGHDPDCRRCMPWNELNIEVYEQVKKLIYLRKNLDELTNSDICFKAIPQNNRIVCYTRGNIDIILNCSDTDFELDNTEKVYFSRKLENNILLSGGICIR